MPPDEISYWPSRAKQFLFLAILFVVFIVSSAGSLILWLNGIIWLLLVCVAVISAIGTPFMMVMMLLPPSPILVVTPKGMRLRDVDLRWEEIDEIHEYVHNRNEARMLPQVVIGLYLRDDEAIRARLSWWAKLQMNHNKKQGMPTIMVATNHLQQSTAEILDEIEDYLEELRREPGKTRKLPNVYRQKE